ncbi:MAG TPA: peptidylprolyl isomerase [Nitrospirales bacterium]|nr:peptidylprolyl isomerase [Nitrospirales bacterium]
MMPPGRSRLTGLACLVLLAAVLSPWSARTAMPAEKPPLPAAPLPKPEKGGSSSGTPQAKSSPQVLIETDRGKITIELFPDVAPRTVAQFTELVKKGFYNGLFFHRVIPRFLVLGGDPAGDGTGGSGRTIPAEFNERKHVAGTVGMARTRDPDSADSQFYLCLEAQPFLDGKYTVFGQVAEGLEVLGKIQEQDVMRRVTLKP